MDNHSMVVNEFERVDNEVNIPAVHPVLVVIFGTTMAELLVVLHTQLEGMQDLVPWRGVLVDSLLYEEVITRLVQNSWPREQVMEAIPRSHFFHLTSPFSGEFDFDTPLNRSWLSTMFEPSLQRLALTPNAPGCAGTPALGRTRVEGNEPELRAFFERHLLELTQVRTETLALLPGVKVFVVTTYRGGTGTGAATPGAAILRSVMTNGDLHLHAIMPCIYLGDDRAYANAYATLRETQGLHGFGRGIPMKGGRVLKAPFETATYMFASNEAVTLGPVDALMQEAAILRAYLRVPTHTVIHARHVDLTDVIPYDLEDKPMHGRVETALSIRTVLSDTQTYLVVEWVRQELEALRDRFETWCQDRTLSPEEEARLREVVEQTIKDLNLHRSALLTRLDPSPAPTNALRNFFEQITTMIGSMKADTIKQGMAGLPAKVRDEFLKFEGSWEDRTRQLAEALPREITDYVTSKLPASPHLALASLGKIRDHLAGLVRDARKEAEHEKKKRDAAAVQLGPALNAVQEAHGILGFINTDEVTRDAAHKACSIMLTAAMARAHQQRLEYLVQALEGEINSLDSRGKPVTISSVATVLRDRQVEQMATIRQRQAEQLNALRNAQDKLGQRIEKRSPVFQRSLLYDGMTRKMLNAEVQEIRARIPDVPLVMRFLEGTQDLPQTIAELLPLLPSYTESGRRLEEILTSDAGKRNLVVQLLRNRAPFTPLDRVVEDQQGLRNRRDTLVILEVPGGSNGTLADLMRREGIVTNLNQVVDSGEDEIRLYFLRDGLPYAAIRSLARYKERHDHYLTNPAAVTPYTMVGAHQLPDMEPSRINLRLYTEAVLYTAKAVLPHGLASRPSGGFTLRYEKDTGYEFTTTQEEFFPDFEAMISWLAKQVQIRKALEAELKQQLDHNPGNYKALLVAAWQRASAAERDHLQEALFRLKIDPYKFPDAGGIPESRDQ